VTKDADGKKDDGPELHRAEENEINPTPSRREGT
jgi:hypothetical protein